MCWSPRGGARPCVASEDEPVPALPALAVALSARARGRPLGRGLGRRGRRTRRGAEGGRRARLPPSPRWRASRRSPPRSASPATLWIKDETRQCLGSHKARHLMGVMLYLRVLEISGLAARRGLARAAPGDRVLRQRRARRGGRSRAPPTGRSTSSFPPTPSRSVVRRLRDLGAAVERLRAPAGREPATLACTPRAARSPRGAIPFGVQGPDNGLAVEGARTLAFEMAETLAAEGAEIDALVRPGGRRRAARARSRKASRSPPRPGLLPPRPAPDRGADAKAAPRWRAPGSGSTASALGDAARHRSRFMWPWDSVPSEPRPRHSRRRDLRLVGGRQGDARNGRRSGRRRRSGDRAGAGPRARPHRHSGLGDGLGRPRQGSSPGAVPADRRRPCCRESNGERADDARSDEVPSPRLRGEGQGEGLRQPTCAAAACAPPSPRKRGEARRLSPLPLSP